MTLDIFTCQAKIAQMSDNLFQFLIQNAQNSWQFIKPLRTYVMNMVIAYFTSV